MSSTAPTNRLSIRTPRLLLRPMTIDDAPDIFQIRSDPETVRYTPIAPDTNIEQTQAWIQKLLTTGKDLNFCIELRGRVMKNCSFPPSYYNGSTTGNRSDSPPKAIGFLSATRIPEVGYGINREFWNKGIMTEVLEGFKGAYWNLFLEGYPGLEGDDRKCLTAQTDKRNPASQAVLKKCGFERWMEEERELKGEKTSVFWYRAWKPEQGKVNGDGYDWGYNLDMGDGELHKSIEAARKRAFGRNEKKKDLRRTVDNERFWARVTENVLRFIRL